VLRQAAMATGRFASLFPTLNFSGAEPHLNGSERLDTVFISKTFGSAAVAQIIVQSKETNQGQFCAYILVLKEKYNEENSELIWNTLLGADAVICEPYSVDALDAITKLSMRVRLQRIEERQRKAFDILITDLIQQLDLVACLKSSGCEMGTSLKMFREKCEALRYLNQDQLKVYLDLAVVRFESAILPPRSFLTGRNAQYRGASRRVQRMLSAKGELEQQAPREEIIEAPKEVGGPRIYRGSSIGASLASSTRRGQRFEAAAKQEDDPRTNTKTDPSSQSKTK